MVYLAFEIASILKENSSLLEQSRPPFLEEAVLFKERTSFWTSKRFNWNNCQVLDCMERV